MFYDTFMKLCEMHGKTASEALRGSGLSKYAYHRWKNGTPTLEMRIKLADYFGVTVEELATAIGTSRETLRRRKKEPWKYTEYEKKIIANVLHTSVSAIYNDMKSLVLSSTGG